MCELYLEAFSHICISSLTFRIVLNSDNLCEVMQYYHVLKIHATFSLLI